MKAANFTIEELLASAEAKRRGIVNVNPPSLDLAAKITLAGLERVRAALGHPMQILSGYRCPELNRVVGGAADSQHMRFEAVDFVCPAFGPPLLIAQTLQSKLFSLGIDQLILEPTWVHMSFTLTPRGETLTKLAKRYVPGIIVA